jgi:hypothetical protein
MPRAGVRPLYWSKTEKSMKALAGFAMSGRRQAILAATLLGILPLLNFLSAPIVALVFLRHGKSEALIVLAWAVLPAAGWAVAGDMIPLLTLLGSTLLAGVLRSFGSWEFALLTAIGVGIAAQLALVLQPGFVELMQQQIALVMANPELQGQVNVLPEDQMQQLLKMFYGMMLMLLAVTVLMLARYWQAALYNPGGFRQEFHQLRLSWKTTAILCSVFVLTTLGPVQLQPFSILFVLPLLIAGVALVHGIAGLKKWPVAVMAIFYVAMMSPVMTQILVLAAIADSWVDFRSRVPPKV